MFRFATQIAVDVFRGSGCRSHRAVQISPCRRRGGHSGRKWTRSIQPVTLIHEPYGNVPPWGSAIPPAPESGPAEALCWSRVMHAEGQTAPVLIDVRSPSEFALDHIPGAINLPVLDDQQRAEIGRLHSHGNILRARMQGASLICANISRMLTDLSHQCDCPCPVDSIRSNPGLLIYCWRGGQRSHSLATILAEVGWPAPIYVLVGGYQSWRRLVLRQLDAWPRWQMPGQFWVISGLTGSGKSLVLHELARVDERVLDLEAIADHKGSLFGANPDCLIGSGDANSGYSGGVSQKQFESKLHHTLTTDRRWTNESQVTWIECESRSVGPRCRLSDALWTRLRATDDRMGAHRVWLEVPDEARVDWILQSYASFTSNPVALDHVLSTLSNYHSRKRIDEWRSFAERADFASLVQGLLHHHYDPLYRQSRNPVMSEAEKHGLMHTIRLPLIDQTTVRNRLIPQLLDLAYGTQTNAHADHALGS